MVATQDDGEDSSIEDAGKLGLEVSNRLLDVTGKDIQITVIDDAEGIEGWLKLIFLPMMGAKLSRCVADSTRAEASAAAIKHRHVHWDADHGSIGQRQIPCNGTAREAVGAAIAWTTLPFGRIEPAAILAFAHAGDDISCGAGQLFVFVLVSVFDRDRCFIGRELKFADRAVRLFGVIGRYPLVLAIFKVAFIVIDVAVKKTPFDIRTKRLRHGRREGKLSGLRAVLESLTDEKPDLILVEPGDGGDILVPTVHELR